MNEPKSGRRSFYIYITKSCANSLLFNYWFSAANVQTNLMIQSNWQLLTHKLTRNYGLLYFSIIMRSALRIFGPYYYINLYLICFKLEKWKITRNSFFGPNILFVISIWSEFFKIRKLKNYQNSKYCINIGTRKVQVKLFLDLSNDKVLTNVIKWKTFKTRTQVSRCYEGQFNNIGKLPRKINFLFCWNGLKFSLNFFFYITFKTKKIHSFYWTFILRVKQKHSATGRVRCLKK